MAYTFNPFTGTFDNAPSTLKGDSAYSTLCAISGDLVTYDYLHDGFLPLSGGTITGNLSVEGNVEIGASSASVTMFISGDRVGINTETPNEELTVVGDISSSGTIYASGGNSNIWNESYSLIQSNSASWVSDLTADTEVRALTSGWVGGNEAYTNLVANSAAYLSAVDLSFLSVSANWDSTYNTVQSNSATNWNYQGTDIKSLTGNWESTYTTFRDASSTFLTSETDSQTLSFDETTKDLSISSGNTVSLSALIDTTAIDTGVRALTSNWESTYETVSALSASWAATEGAYLPLSGGTITGNLQVSGTTTLSGSVEIGTGAGDAKFFVGGGKVGVGTETPNEELTVVGNISASNVVYASGGNSILWNEVFTSYSSNSSTFITSETDSQTLSFDEVTKDLSISNGNSVSLSALVDTTAIDTGVRALTSNWESTYNTVSALSASWSAADEVLLAQVTNADSVTLNRGDVVYSFGATGSVMSVKLASNSGDSTSATTLGVVNETIIPNGIGYVTVAGRMEQMSFPHPFVDGDILYLGNTPGTFTRVKPVAPEHGVYLGVVERANNGNGIVYVKVQNGYELNEIHDVLITSVSAGQVIRRNSTNNLWINTNDGANWDSVYTTVTAASANWQGTYTNFSANSAVYVKTVATTTPGTSAITTIVAVSALPPTQVPGTLYILI